MQNKLKFIFSSLAGIILLVSLIWWIGFEKLLILMGQASWFWLFLSGLNILPTYLVRAWRWKILLTPIKNPAKISNTFWSTAIGYMVNTLIPVRLGEFIKAYIVGEKEKIGFASVFSSVIVERTLDLIGLLTMGIAILVMLPIEGVELGLTSFKVVGVLLALILATLFLAVKKEEKIISTVKKFFSYIPILSKRRDKIVGFVESLIYGVKSIGGYRKMLPTVMGLTWFLWFIQLLTVYMVFKAFNQPTPILIVFFGAVILYFTYILPSVPGYVGTHETCWTLIFLSLGLGQADLLFVMGLAGHLVGLTAMIVVGCLGVVWLGLSFEDVFRLKK